MPSEAAQEVRQDSTDRAPAPAATAVPPAWALGAEADLVAVVAVVAVGDAGRLGSVGWPERNEGARNAMSPSQAKSLGSPLGRACLGVGIRRGPTSPRGPTVNHKDCPCRRKC